MKFKKTIASIAAVLAISASSAAYAADVVIGVPNWPSVRVTAHILKTIMEDSLGLEVELQNGTNPVIFEGMDAGSMHVHPEVWLPNQINLNQKYVKEKGTVRMTAAGVAGDQAICATKGTAERTGIVDLSDLSDPDMAKHFDTDGDGMGEVWIGAAGWASTNVEKIKAKSYGYDQTMTLKEMDETLALAELDNAVAQNKDIVIFCYTPHHMFALHELVILKELAYDESKWVVIQPTDDPEWLEKSSAPVAWNTAYLHIHYATSLENDFPAAAEFLSKVDLNTDAVSAMTYALVVDKADPGEFAKKWVSENSAMVDAWLQ